MAAVADILDDLALLIARVQASVDGRSYEQLVENAEAYDALTYRLAMVGETCKKLPEDLKNGIRWCNGAKWPLSETLPVMTISESMGTLCGERPKASVR